MVMIDRSEQESFVLKRWRRLLAEARGLGGRIALFGAGQHTRWLLSVLPPELSEGVVVVLDDRAAPGRQCRDLPVVRPDSVPLGEIDLVIVSSDRYERELLGRATEVFRNRCPIRGIYNGRSFVTQWGRSVRQRRFRRLRAWLETAIYGPERRWNLAERFVRACQRAELRRVWHEAPAPPHFGDHRTALHLWSEHRDPEFVACGTYARELMEPGCQVLDLCCGDGFYAHHFYSGVAGHVDAVDIDEQALRLARRHHQASNIHYHRLDALTEEFPRDRYDVVVWDGALGHFTESQVDCILSKISRAIGEAGVLCGSETVETEASKSWDHFIALGTPGGVRRLLAPHFPSVGLLARAGVEPRVYFRASRQADRLAGWQVESDHGACPADCVPLAVSR